MGKKGKAFLDLPDPDEEENAPAVAEDGAADGGAAGKGKKKEKKGAKKGGKKGAAGFDSDDEPDLSKLAAGSGDEKEGEPAKPQKQQKKQKGGAKKAAFDMLDAEGSDGEDADSKAAAPKKVGVAISGIFHCSSLNCTPICAESNQICPIQ